MRRKWSPRSKLLFGLAGVSALAAFVLVRGYADRLQAMDPGAPVSVVVAATDLARGTSLSSSAVKLEEMPSAFVPPGAVSAVGQAQGRTLIADIDAGEVLTNSRLGSGAGPVAALVPDGLRAMTLPTSLPTGTVSPGDRVDVLATYAGGQPYTETVGSGIEVLDVLAPTDGGLADGPKGAVLVVLVDPSGAEQLAHAVAAARIDVAVVGAAEGAVTQTPQAPTPSPTP